jgi:hypothetical protein
MRLAWTAIVPRVLVERSDTDRLVRQSTRLLTILPHPDPALCVVRCYQHDRRAGRLPAA